jgi:glutamate carboxypeptidase
MDPILAFTQAHQAAIIETIRQMVEVESPSDDRDAVNRHVEQLCDMLSGEAKLTRKKGGTYGDHLLVDFNLPGKKKTGQVLALGHTDTVYPLGILKTMPWRVAEGRLWGPGVLDMKGGVAFFIHAMRALRELDIPVASKVVLQLNSDEEVGSHSSRALTEAMALKSKCVLVLEPGTGLTGKLKTARKGVGGYEVTVHGKAAHAGVDKGLTVNPGVIRGGTRTNVVPAEAVVEVDLRIARLRDGAFLEKKFRGLKPVDKRCTLTVTGGLNRPPMERTKAIAALFAKARGLAAELGVVLEESATGGGSDGNFSAALGVPTLDGLGTVGEGAHAVNESILVDRIADRTALLAKLVAAL